MHPVSCRPRSLYRLWAPSSGILRRQYSKCVYLAAPWSGAKPSIKVTFRLPNGKQRDVMTPVGTTMLEAAQENGVDIEGACGGEAACSTCHVIVDEASFAKLGKPSEEEIDMLDLAAGLTKTSRLGCQIIAQPELDGMVLQLPAEVHSMLEK